MSTRWNAPLSALLALALVCLAPARLSAHTKARPARKIVAAHSHKAEPRRVAAHSRASAKQHRREAEPRPVSHTRSRHKDVAPTPHLVARHDPHALPPPLVLHTPATPARPASAVISAVDTQATGISHPPDFNDLDATPVTPASSKAAEQPPADPAVPLPAVNIVRKTPSERPQLPSVQEVAATPEILPTLYNKRGRLMMPPPMKGSREILLHQNEVADLDGLTRVQDDRDLEQMRARRMLVAVPINMGMQVDERLPANRRYCRPWTAAFLEAIARAHYAQFHTPLQVNSAVRTVEFQQRLMRTNGNAAPAEGETASPHLTGQAVDIAKHGLSLSEIAWMRGYLMPLVQGGKIDVEEEFQQACFHISVYKKYLPPAATPRRSIASTHGRTAGSLAVAIP